MRLDTGESGPFECMSSVLMSSIALPVLLLAVFKYESMCCWMSE